MNFHKSLLPIFLSAICFVANAQIEELSEEEQQQLGQAVKYYHNQVPDLSIGIIEKLLVKHPNNYLLNYELCLPKFQKGQYAEVVKITKKLERHPNAEAILYQLQGNAYDYLGKRKAAVESYDKGLKKFPKAGPLYMEKGNIRLMEKDPNGALDMYEKALEVQPSFPSPYFRASALLLNTSEPVWGLIYGEAFLNLEKGNRNESIQNGIRKKLDSCFELEGDTALKIHLSRNVITLNGLELVIPFEIEYELAVSKSKAVLKMKSEKRSNVTIADLIEIRMAIAKQYKENWEKNRPNYLFEYQNLLIDGGYFEAYTMDLFKDAYAEDYKAYMEKPENQDVMNALHVWMKQHPFEPNESKLINRNYKK